MRTQLYTEQIWTQAIDTTDIKDWTIKLEDLSTNLLDYLRSGWININFSYNKIEEWDIIEIQNWQQMWVWEWIDIDWKLILEWDLILNI